MKTFNFAVIVLLAVSSVMAWLKPGSAEDQGISLGLLFGIAMILAFQRQEKRYFETMQKAIKQTSGQELNRRVLVIALVSLFCVIAITVWMGIVYALRIGLLAAAAGSFVAEVLLIIVLRSVSLRVFRV